MRPFIVRYVPALATLRGGRSTNGYMAPGEGGANSRPGPGRSTRGGTVGVESQIESGRARSGSKGVDDSSVSIHGSEVELAQTTRDSRRSDPFEVHVVRELRVGEERGPRVAPEDQRMYAVPPGLRA